MIDAGKSQRKVQAADASSYRQEMIPLPLRVAKLQYSRLSATRDRTGISIQEHVRRAIDLYLAVVEREAIELGMIPGEPEAHHELAVPKVIRK